MVFSTERDDFGGLVCRVEIDGQAAHLEAADAAAAAADLQAALEAVRDGGSAECVWQTSGGDYRWVLRRQDETLTVVALWSRGVATGWQHVLHAEIDPDAFASNVTKALSGLREDGHGV